MSLWWKPSRLPCSGMWRWGSAGTGHAGSSEQTPSSEWGSCSVRGWQHTGPKLARVSYCQAHLQECKTAWWAALVQYHHPLADTWLVLRQGEQGYSKDISNSSSNYNNKSRDCAALFYLRKAGSLSSCFVWGDLWGEQNFSLCKPLQGETLERSW